ncbi:MAG: hypothetical protein ABJO09_20595 [Hyphomicrobiales bacterium]
MTDQSISSRHRPAVPAKAFRLSMIPGFQHLKNLFGNHCKRQVYLELLSYPDDRLKDVNLRREQVVAALKSVGGDMPPSKPQTAPLQTGTWC